MKMKQLIHRLHDAVKAQYIIEGRGAWAEFYGLPLIDT
jgi:hypothetical protein